MISNPVPRDDIFFDFFMVAFTNPMYKKSCELTEDNNNNVDNIVIVKHWEGG